MGFTGRLLLDVRHLRRKLELAGPEHSGFSKDVLEQVVTRISSYPGVRAFKAEGSQSRTLLFDHFEISDPFNMDFEKDF